ncbi:glycoside hydrolase family 105 protein [Paenibacillus sp. LMG 31458]|uniref:Glycoside hydrolase family 105 protein n=1 Tax=Paenibacillus phytorum TaxID=2654977 RepID=A0ABX1Y1J7_9BACL|nr:glycoside hydrolase family 88 protein [Paenibacillus phytorum]NOU74725.1 glycoside hydrolase family 105 protein [Paenibacillus phytorum]
MKGILENVARTTMQMDFNVDKKGDWDWGAGVALYGLRKVYETTGSQEIYNFIKTFIDSNMANSQNISYNINTTAPLLSVLLLYRETGEPHYLDFAEKFASWLMKEAPRLSNGALEHTVINDKFAGEMWVDTVFMAGVFLTELGQILNKAAYIEEGLLQARLHIEALQTRGNGLLYHGYSLASNHHLSGCLWARGNSWVTISIPEIFATLTGYEKEKSWFFDRIQLQVEALAAVQKDNGMWSTILDDASSYEETSATAGFVYGISKSVRMGYLDKKYLLCAEKGYKAVLRHITEEGTVLSVSAGTGIQRSIQEYNAIPRQSIMPWGQGITLLMLCQEAHETT